MRLVSIISADPEFWLRLLVIDLMSTQFQPKKMVNSSVRTVSGVKKKLIYTQSVLILKTWTE